MCHWKIYTMDYYQKDGVYSNIWKENFIKKFLSTLEVSIFTLLLLYHRTNIMYTVNFDTYSSLVVFLFLTLSFLNQLLGKIV